MAALNNVIYGDCRTVSSTLTSFLSSDSVVTKKVDYECHGHDISLFVDEDRASAYLCPICQHVLKDAMDIGCGNKHYFCSSCFDVYYTLNYQDYDNNYLYYGVGNEDWNDVSDPNLWNPNRIKHQFVKCPLCQSLLKEEATKMDSIDRFITTELKVRCPLEIAGKEGIDRCTWIGTLKELGHHQTADCEYQMVQCDDSKCSFECPLKLMRKHVEENHASNSNEHCIL